MAEGSDNVQFQETTESWPAKLLNVRTSFIDGKDIQHVIVTDAAGNPVGPANPFPAVLYDSAGNPIASHLSADGGYHSATSMIQDVHADPNNSSTDNLAAAATFTGVSTTTLGVIGLQVNFSADQNCTVFVEQSTDDVNWDITNEFAYNHLTTEFGRTVQATASFWRVRVTNLSSTTATTHFRLQGVLCPVAVPMNSAPNVRGHQQVEMIGLQDNFAHQGQFSPMRDLKTIDPFRMVGSPFGASLDTTFWAVNTSGAGAAAGVASSIATVSSGTANNGYGQILTVQTAGFEFAHPLQYRSAIRIADITIAENTRQWGALTVSTTTPQNGFYFELDEDGILSVVKVSGGTPDPIVSGAFNGDVNEYIMDTNVHAYEIIFFTMGAWFYIDDVLIHEFKPTTALLAETNNVSVVAQSVNSASGVTSGTIECWNGIIIKLGREITSPVSFYQAGTVATKVLKVGWGTIHQLVISGVINNSVITLYDNTAASGTILWSSGAMGAKTDPFNVDLTGVSFFIGLTMSIVTANSNVTIIFE